LSLTKRYDITKYAKENYTPFGHDCIEGWRLNSASLANISSVVPFLTCDNENEQLIEVLRTAASSFTHAASNEDMFLIDYSLAVYIQQIFCIYLNSSP
jgi:hypothetical protein